MKRGWVILLAMSLVVAACGGGRAEGSASTSSTEPTVDAGTEPAASVDPVSSGAAGTGTDPGGEGPSTATVTIGDETYEFSSEGGVGINCDPDLFGIMSVILPLADGGDGGVEIIALHEGTDPVEVEVNNRVHVRFADGNWVADPEDVRFNGDPDGAAMSHVDSVEIDGNTLKGTASFVGSLYASPEVVTMTGTFEATCGE